jgi:hypothetical protein
MECGQQQRRYAGEKWLIPNWKWSRWGFGSKPKEDFVQVEIESALDLGVPIVPLLVDSVAMPHLDALLNSIAEFVLLNAAAIRSGRDFYKNTRPIERARYQAQTRLIKRRA